MPESHARELGTAVETALTMRCLFRRSQAGVTLIEIMVVLAIIGLIVGIIVGPSVMRRWREAQVRTARLQVADLTKAYALWRLDHADQICPANLEELKRYAASGRMRDPWGVAYAMRCGDDAPPEEEFGAMSNGPDRRVETEDDIHSWDETVSGGSGRD
jgi:general secretion pathway protein G